jgi:hypothetical protein
MNLTGRVWDLPMNANLSSTPAVWCLMTALNDALSFHGRGSVQRSVTGTVAFKRLFRHVAWLRETVNVKACRNLVGKPLEKGGGHGRQTGWWYLNFREITDEAGSWELAEHDEFSRTRWYQRRCTAGSAATVSFTVLRLTLVQLCPGDYNRHGDFHVMWRSATTNSLFVGILLCAMRHYMIHRR